MTQVDRSSLRHRVRFDLLSEPSTLNPKFLACLSSLASFCCMVRSLLTAQSSACGVLRGSHGYDSCFRPLILHTLACLLSPFLVLLAFFLCLASFKPFVHLLSCSYLPASLCPEDHRPLFLLWACCRPSLSAPPPAAAALVARRRGRCPSFCMRHGAWRGKDSEQALWLGREAYWSKT